MRFIALLRDVARFPLSEAGGKGQVHRRPCAMLYLR